MSELILEKNIPNGWIRTNLEDCVEILDGMRKPINSSEREIRRGKIPYYGATGQVGFIDDYLFDEELVLLGEDGAPFFDGFKNKAYLVNGKSWVNNHAHVLKGKAEIILNKFLCHYLNQIDYHEYVNGTTRLKLNQSKMKQIPISIPSLNEQKRIVTKVEELFSKIDISFDSLRKTKLQLKSYKSSLLKSGFLGELTKDGRDSNSYDSVEQLMEKIKDNRIKQEKKLQKIQLPKEDEEYFHQIPHSWRWVRVGNVCQKIQYGTSEKANGSSSGIPVLRMGNIIDGELNFDDLKFFSQDWSNKNEFLLEPGDVLFNRTNSAELVGKTAIFEDHHPPSVFASYLIRAKVASEIMLPKILSHYTNSGFGRIFIKSVVSQQVGQANVNGTKFSMMCIPLIPMKEQIELIDKIETGISLIQNISKEIDSILQNLFSLKSSILKDAFEGKLVPQDPTDEPAEFLLQKIKQEKEKLEQTQRVYKAKSIKSRRIKNAS